MVQRPFNVAATRPKLEAILKARREVDGRVALRRSQGKDLHGLAAVAELVGDPTHSARLNK